MCVTPQIRHTGDRMNYKTIYEKLIQKAKNREKPNIYCEKHHIIPKCLNGSNDITNLVYLTAKEHYVAHHLLCKINPNNCNLFFAFNAMNNWKSRNTNQRYKPRLSARQYEYLKIKRSKYISECLKNRPKSEEHKKHLSAALKGRKTPISEETRLKISAIQKKIIHTEEWNRKVGESLKKHKRTKEHCENISKAKKGKHINYNMNSAGFRNSQKGVNNYQAIKCYIDGELIGCKKDLSKYIMNKYKLNIDKLRIKEISNYIKQNNYKLISKDFEMLLLKCLNEHIHMKHRQEIFNSITQDTIKDFINSNEIKALDKLIAPHCLGNTQVKV